MAGAQQRSAGQSGGSAVAAIAEGRPAPTFRLSASNGESIDLDQFKGKRHVVLYFYPKDDTPGCTVEACAFRDDIKEFEQRNAVVLGVSFDGEASHQRFVGKFQLPFLLLSDEEKTVAQSYGVYKQKSMYGRTFWGIERTTFVIGKNGVVSKIFPKVKPDGHSREVLATLDELNK